MNAYTTLLKEKFPLDERLGLYKAPHLPAVKVGKILMNDSRINSPNDIVALHLSEGLFSSLYVMFTATQCYYKGGSFILEDLREVKAQEDQILVWVNQKGSSVQLSFDVKDAATAQVLQKVLQNIVSFDPNAQAAAAPDYSAFEGKALDWLLLRDEVLKTIDLLADKFNEGKLTLLEYEDKKEELLKRL